MNEDLRLELLTSSDGEAFYYIVNRNEKRIERYFPKTINNAVTKLIAIRSLRNYIRLAQRKEQFVFGLKSKNKLVGVLFLKNFDWHLKKAEVAYFIDEKEQGKGRGSQGIRLLLDKAFEDLCLNKLYARIALDNESSQGVVLKNGFQLEGKLRGEYKLSNGKLIDLNYYGILKEDVRD